MAIVSSLDPGFVTALDESWPIHSQEEVVVLLDEDSLAARDKLGGMSSFWDNDFHFSSQHFVAKRAISAKKEANDATTSITITADGKCEPKILDEQPLEPVRNNL